MTCVQQQIAENSQKHTVKRHTMDSLELMPRACREQTIVIVIWSTLAGTRDMTAHDVGPR